MNCRAERGGSVLVFIFPLLSPVAIKIGFPGRDGQFGEGSESVSFFHELPRDSIKTHKTSFAIFDTSLTDKLLSSILF